MIFEKKQKRKSLNKEKCEIVIKINKLKEKFTVLFTINLNFNIFEYILF